MTHKDIKVVEPAWRVPLLDSIHAFYRDQTLHFGRLIHKKVLESTTSFISTITSYIYTTRSLNFESTLLSDIHYYLLCLHTLKKTPYIKRKTYVFLTRIVDLLKQAKIKTICVRLL